MSLENLSSLNLHNADISDTAGIEIGKLADMPVKKTARASTTAALAANTYNNGTSGVGATLTGNSNGALAAQDGVTLSVGDRLLVRNESTQSHNGLYKLTQLGDVSHPYILTRSTSMDSSEKFNNNSVIVGSEGSTLAGSIYQCSYVSSFVVGTSNVVFVKINGSGAGSIVRPITFNADGSGGVISIGHKVYLTIPYACTLTDFYLAADVSGSIQIDVKRLGTSIIGGGNKLILSSAQRANAALSGWTSVTISPFDELEFYIDSCSLIGNINAVLVATT